MGEAEWQEAFDLYKMHAKKQFESLHADMTVEGIQVYLFLGILSSVMGKVDGFCFYHSIPNFLEKRVDT